MERHFENVPMCLSLDVRETSELAAIGFIDGQVDLCTFDVAQNDIKVIFSQWLSRTEVLQLLHFYM